MKNVLVKIIFFMGCSSFLIAQTLLVTTTADSGPGSLREALSNAQINDQIDCSQVKGQTITLQSSLPPIVNNLVVNSTLDSVTIDANGYQPFFVFDGTVQINSFTIKNAIAQGAQGGDALSSGSIPSTPSLGPGGGGGVGAGGAVFVNVNASVTLESIDFQQNQAIGGRGGNADFLNGQGGQGAGGGGAFGGGAGGGGMDVYITGVGGGGGGYPGGGAGAAGALEGNNGDDGSGIGGGGGSAGTENSSLAPLGGKGGAAGGGGNGGLAKGAVGGGGGGYGFNGKDGDKGGGGGGSGGGGAGGDASTPGDGGPLGGGGGGADGGGGENIAGGAGGFGAGGGSSFTGPGGKGGIGGGGGGGGNVGAGSRPGGKSLFAGGEGGRGADTGSLGQGGGGGAAFGGAVYVHSLESFGSPGSLIFKNCVFDSNHQVIGGQGGTVQGNANPGDPGLGLGQEIFLVNGAHLELDVETSLTLSHAIESIPPELENIQGTQRATITKQGSGTVTLQGQPSAIAPTITGDLTIKEGTLVVDTNALVASGVIDVQGGALTLNNLGVVSGYQAGSHTVPLNLSVEPGASVGGTGQIGTSTIPANVSIKVEEGGTMDLTPTLVGTGSLTSATGSMGTLQVSATNTYSGGTQIGGGILSVSGVNNLGTGIVQFIGTGTLYLSQGISNFNLPISIGENLVGTIDVGTFSSSISGVVEGEGTLDKVGSGTLTLTAANTYTGGTKIGAGTLAINSVDGLGTNAVEFSGSSTLEFTQGINDFNLPVTIDGAVVGTIDVGTNQSLMSGSISGAGSFQKSGSGVLSLSGSTSVQGTTIASGKLAMIQNGVLSGDVTIDSGATFDISQINASSFNGESLEGEGAVELGSKTFILNPTTSSSFNGSITGSGGRLVKQGGGAQTLGGNNTYTGGTTLADGTLSIGTSNNLGAGSLTFSGTSTLEYNQAIPNFTSSISIDSQVTGTINVGGNDSTISGSITGQGSLDKKGAGTLALSNATNDYGGGTTISEGTLALVQNGTLIGDVTISSGAVFDLSQLTPSSFSLEGLSGLGSVQLGSKSLIVNTQNQDQYSGVIQGSSGSGSLVKQGTGTLTLGGVNTYGGGTTFSGGILSVSKDQQLGANTGALTFSGGTLNASDTFSSNRSVSIEPNGGVVNIDTGKSLTLDGIFSGSGSFTKEGAGLLSIGNTQSTFTGPLHLNEGNFVVTASAALGTTGDTIFFSGGELEITKTLSTARDISLEDNALILIDSGVDVTLSGEISGSKTLTKQGAGSLLLSGNNSYEGATFVTAGTLIGNTSSLPTSITNQGTLIFDQAASGTFDPSISGAGVVMKQGSGTLTFSSENTYTGGTVIDAGTLSIGNANQLGTGTVTFKGTSTLQFDQMVSDFKLSVSIASAQTATLDVGSFNSTIGSTITGPGTLKKTGSGVLTLSGKNNYSRGTMIEAGTLSIGSINLNSGFFKQLVTKHYGFHRDSKMAFFSDESMQQGPKAS